MLKIYLNGELYKIGTMPQTIHGVKLSRLDVATDEQLAKHGITYEPYVPPEPEPPTPEEQAEQFKAACMSGLQSMLDAKAQEFGFESIHTAIAWGTDRPYGAELKAWGKACWEMAEAIQLAVLTGGREVPESVEDFLDELPYWGAYA